MSIRQMRYCDVCEAEFSERPDWMILSAPNAPAEVEAEWDFCSYACLVTWMTTDEVDDAGPDFGPEHDQALATGQVAKLEISEEGKQAMRGEDLPPVRERSLEEQAEAQARLDAAMAAMGDKPPMSLMEALASGALKFDRAPQ